MSRADTSFFAFHDTAGQAQGFFSISFFPVEEWAGPRKHAGLLLFSKYFYFRAAYRGHYKSLVAPWLLLPLSFWRYGLRSFHFVASTYPQSFVSLSRSAGNVRALRSPSIEPWQARALERFAAHFYPDGFDRERGVVKNPSCVSTESLPRTPEAKVLAQTYEALNPHWRQGYSLPIIFSVNGPMLRHGLRRMLRRLLGSRPGASYHPGMGSLSSSTGA